MRKRLALKNGKSMEFIADIDYEVERMILREKAVSRLLSKFVEMKVSNILHTFL